MARWGRVISKNKAVANSYRELSVWRVSRSLLGKKTRRVAKASRASEIFAAADSPEFAECVRALCADALAGNIPLAVCAGCESLIDHKKGARRLLGNNLHNHFPRLQQNTVDGTVGSVCLPAGNDSPADM